jgi:hypothetical protein
VNVVTQLQDLGYVVQLEGTEVVCRWSGPGYPEGRRVLPLLDELKRTKPEVVESLLRELPEEVENWPAAWRSALNYRTVVITGNITISEARERAEDLVRESYRRKFRMLSR